VLGDLQKKGVEKTMVEPIAIAGAVANTTAVLPVIQDAITYFANWMATNYIGQLAIGMTITAFGAGLVIGLIKRRRGRR